MTQDVLFRDGYVYQPHKEQNTKLIKPASVLYGGNICHKFVPKTLKNRQSAMMKVFEK